MIRYDVHNEAFCVFLWFKYLFILTAEYDYLKIVHRTDRPKMMKFRSGPGDARMPEWPVRPCLLLYNATFQKQECPDRAKITNCITEHQGSL